MASKTFSEIGVLGLYTETPLHCGAEGGTGYVDLPIQRERHTHYPVIPGSTVKGVLRDELAGGLTGEQIDAVFGKEVADGKSTIPGSVSFGDGVLVAFPIRSSGAPFHWVTCPFVLERVYRALGVQQKVQSPGAGQAWAKEGGKDSHVLLEEIRLTRVADAAFFTDDAGSPVSRLLDLLPEEEKGFGYTRSIFRDRLLIVSDKDFKELVETGTDVVARIKLTALGTTTNIPDGEHTEIQGNDRKGNMFVEELVPPEALFLASLRGDGRWTDALVQALKARPVIRLGGDETVGRGVTHMSYVPGKGV
ncbi:MAG TPA: type III-B CRISPR module RAMP protein Cmr4 [Thermoanaerobaculia bacterium]